MSGASAARPPALTRRRGLALVAALVPATLVAGCGDDSTGTVSPPRVTPVEPGPLESVAVAEVTLIALYDSVLKALPGSDAGRREALLALRQQHVEHYESLMPGTPPPDTAATPEDAPVAPGIRDLAAAERRAAKARIASCVETEDPDLARTLAFIAASEASHVPVLAELL